MHPVSKLRRFTVIGGLAVLLLCAPLALRADAAADGERGIAEYRIGNLIEGMELLEKSAAAGYAPAQTMLAFILDAAEQDRRALHWYQQAADANDAAGLFGLGGMYAKGEGTARDERKAGVLIGRAARLDHVQAMRVYAHALEHAQLGLAPSPHDAAAWYRKAAERGDEVSMQRLVKAYRLGQLGLAQDTARADAWQQKLTNPE